MGIADWKLMISGWRTDSQVNVFHNTGTISLPPVERTGHAGVYQMIVPSWEWVQP